MSSKRAQAPASPADAIANLISRRDGLREQRQIVAAAPRALEEALADIPTTIAALAARFRPPVAFLARAGGFGDLAHAVGAHSPNEYQPVTAAAVLAWASPATLTAALERDLTAAYEAMPAPMSTADKAAELRRLDAEIAKVETEIATTFWQAVDSGMQIPVPDVHGARLIGLAE